MANERRECDSLLGRQAVAGSSPVSRSSLGTVSVQALLEPVWNNRTVMKHAEGGFSLCKKALCDVLPRNPCDILPRLSSLPGCLQHNEQKGVENAWHRNDQTDPQKK